MSELESREESSVNNLGVLSSNDLNDRATHIMSATNNNDSLNDRATYILSATNNNDEIT